ncbi:MAG: TlpA disulfide reductase family protein [Candidatus Thiodiazotropha sp.]|jgi:peroxiredoxin
MPHSKLRYGLSGLRPAAGSQSPAGRRYLTRCGWLVLAFSLLLQPVLAKDGGRPTIPDTQYPDLSGTPQNLQQWKGKVLLLNFWASWCSPCLAEIGHLTEYQDKFGAQGLQVVGLGLDDPRKLKNVQRSLRINYPVLAAKAKESRSILKAWGNKTGLIPYTVIFDKQGEIVRAHRGILDDQLFDQLVKPLLEAHAE